MNQAVLRIGEIGSRSRSWGESVSASGNWNELNWSKSWSRNWRNWSRSGRMSRSRTRGRNRD